MTNASSTASDLVSSFSIDRLVLWRGQAVIDDSKPRRLLSRDRVVLLSIFVVFSLACAAGCGAMRLNSNWRDRPVIINGSTDDWEGLLRPVDDGAAYVGIMNDSDFIYICLMTARADLHRRLSGMGLLVSFQPDDDNKPPLSIHYPVRPLPPDGGPRAIQTNEELQQDQPFDERTFSRDLAVAEVAAKNSQDRTRISIDSTPGLHLMISGRKDWFVYELQIPLAAPGQYPIAIDSKAGENVTIRLQAEKPDLSRMRDREPGGGEPGRGGRGGVGHPGGRMGGGGRGERGAPGQAPVAFDVSADVPLAPGPPI